MSMSIDNLRDLRKNLIFTIQDAIHKFNDECEKEKIKFDITIVKNANANSNGHNVSVYMEI